MAAVQVARMSDSTNPFGINNLQPNFNNNITKMTSPHNLEGITPLMVACQQGRAIDVRHLIKKKRDAVRDRTRSEKVPLHFCSEGGSVDCLEVVLEADLTLINAQDEEGYTPLHLAVINGNKDIVKAFIAAKADLNCLDNEKHSLVHWATVCGELDILDILLTRGASATTADIHLAHPIHYAAQLCGNVNGLQSDTRSRVQSTLYGVSPKKGLLILRRLIQHGVPIDVRDQDGRQPLLWAASAGSADAILSLVNAGAGVEAEDKDGLAALHCAASRGHTDCLETLIALCGAEVDVIDKNGCTALFYAITLGHADCTELLLNFGAEPNRQDRKGRTPAHCGASKGQLETIKLYAKHEGNLWLRNVRGDLPLHEAVISRRKDLVTWLLSQRPDTVNAPNNDGRCPIHLAALNNNVEMVKILIDHHADVNPLMRTGKGIAMTPLDAAIHRGNSAVAKFLQLHGGLPANSLNDASLHRRLNRSLDSQARSSSSLHGSQLGNPHEQSPDNETRVNFNSPEVIDHSIIHRYTHGMSGTIVTETSRIVTSTPIMHGSSMQTDSRHFLRDMEVQVSEDFPHLDDLEEIMSTVTELTIIVEGSKNLSAQSRKPDKKLRRKRSSREKSSEVGMDSTDSDTARQELANSRSSRLSRSRKSSDSSPTLKVNNNEESGESKSSETKTPEEIMEKEKEIKKKVTADASKGVGATATTGRSSSQESTDNCQNESEKFSELEAVLAPSSESEIREEELGVPSRADSAINQIKSRSGSKMANSDTDERKSSGKSAIKGDTKSRTPSRSDSRRSKILEEDNKSRTPSAGTNWVQENKSRSNSGKEDITERVKSGKPLEIKSRSASAISQRSGHISECKSRASSADFPKKHHRSNSTNPLAINKLDSEGNSGAPSGEASSVENISRVSSTLDREGGIGSQKSSRNSSGKAEREDHSQVNDLSDQDDTNPQHSRPFSSKHGTTKKSKESREETKDTEESTESRDSNTEEMSTIEEVEYLEVRSEISQNRTISRNSSAEIVREVTSSPGVSTTKNESQDQSTECTTETTDSKPENETGDPNITTQGGRSILISDQSSEHKDDEILTQSTNNDSENRTDENDDIIYENLVNQISLQEAAARRRKSKSKSDSPLPKRSVKRKPPPPPTNSNYLRTPRNSTAKSTIPKENQNLKDKRSLKSELSPSPKETLTKPNRSPVTNTKPPNKTSHKSDKPTKIDHDLEEAEIRLQEELMALHKRGNQDLTKYTKQSKIPTFNKGKRQNSIEVVSNHIHVPDLKSGTTGRHLYEPSLRTRNPSDENRSILSDDVGRANRDSGYSDQVIPTTSASEDHSRLHMPSKSTGSIRRRVLSKRPKSNTSAVLKKSGALSSANKVPKTSRDRKRFESTLAQRQAVLSHENGSEETTSHGGSATSEEDRLARHSKRRIERPRSKLTFSKGEDIANSNARLTPQSKKPVDIATPISVTQAMQASMRKYHLERKIFQELLELKRLQIRAGKANEQVLVKRLSDSYKKAGLSINYRDYEGPFTFRNFEKYLYDQLRLLQANRRILPRFAPSDDLEKLSTILKKMNATKLPFLEDVDRCDEHGDHSQCTLSTHRCHHAAHAYTGIPCAAYIGKGRRTGFLPRVDPLKSPGPTQNDPVTRNLIMNGQPGMKMIVSPRGEDSPITLEVQQGAKTQVFALPSQSLDPTKNYYVSLSIRPTPSPPVPPGSPKKDVRNNETVINDNSGQLSAPPPPLEKDSDIISISDINNSKLNQSF